MFIPLVVCLGLVFFLPETIVAKDSSGKNPVKVVIRNGAENDKLAQFVADAMANYPDWLNSQLLDPTDSDPEEYHWSSRGSSKVKVNLAVRNVYMMGHSNSDLYDNIEVYAQFGFDKDDHREIDVRINTVGILFGGEYVANGTVSDIDEGTGEPILIPLSGSGEWKVKTNEGMVSFRYANFKLLEDDRFDFGGSLPSSNLFRTDASPENIEFEGILEGNAELKKYENEIKVELADAYFWIIRSTERNPSAVLFAKYAENFRGYYGFSMA